MSEIVSLRVAKLATRYTSSVLVAMLVSSLNKRPLVNELLWTPTAITRCRFFPFRSSAAAAAGSKPKLDAPSVKTTSTRGTFRPSGRIPFAAAKTLVSTLLRADDVWVPPVSWTIPASAVRAAASVVPAVKNMSWTVRSENCDSATCAAFAPTVRLRISSSTKPLASLKSAVLTESDPSIRNAMSSVVSHWPAVGVCTHGVGASVCGGQDPQ
jgi:hypothetical protein